MQVILMEDVANLGKKGELKEVAKGYARNHLFPRNLAALATPQRLKEWEKSRDRQEEQNRQAEEAARAKAAEIEATELVFHRPSGEGGRLFGSVTPADIAEALAENKLIVEKKRIEIHEPIKSLGNYIASVRLHPGIKAALKIKVKSEE